MELSEFRLLLCVAECGSISAAARRLGISPSLATRKLAAMERGLGVRLVNRTTRRLDMSEAGRLVCDNARELLGRYEETMDAIQQLNSQPAGEVRVVCPGLLATRVLPSMLRSFGGKYPFIRVKLTVLDDATQLADDSVDVIIHVGSPPSNDLVVKHVQDVSMLLCSSPEYLSEFPEPKEPDELAVHRCLDHSSLYPGEWCFRRRGRPLRSVVFQPYLQTSSTLVLREAALQGLGIARLSRRVVGADLDSGRLVPILPQFDCVLANDATMAVWVMLPHRQVLHRTRLFVDSLVTAIRESDGG